MEPDLEDLVVRYKTTLQCSIKVLRKDKIGGHQLFEDLKIGEQNFIASVKYCLLSNNRKQINETVKTWLLQLFYYMRVIDQEKDNLWYKIDTKRIQLFAKTSNSEVNGLW